MPKPAPLPGLDRARATLAHRLTRRVDRIRQLYTRFGVRSRRVFMVWTKWSGRERGEGHEVTVARRELLPTPELSDSTAVKWNFRAVGAVPEGALRVSEVSAGAYTKDNLMGVVIPPPAATEEAPRPVPGMPLGWDEGAPVNVQPVDFFYVVVEDGRGDRLGERERYRLNGTPWREEDGFHWVLDLERADPEEHRNGTSASDDADGLG